MTKYVPSRCTVAPVPAAASASIPPEFGAERLSESYVHR